MRYKVGDPHGGFAGKEWWAVLMLDPAKGEVKE